MTMRKWIFGSRVKDAEKEIYALRAQRAACVQRVRTLKEEMNRLVDSAVGADELEQKILSLDYEAKRDVLAAETQRFQDLSGLIARLQKAQAVDEGSRRLDGVAAAGSRIDTAALLREEDELRARRAMMDEEERDFAAAQEGYDEKTRDAFAADEGFAALVREAKLRRMQPVAPAQTAQPAEA